MLVKITKECVVRGVCLIAGVALIGVIIVAPYFVGQGK